MDYQVITASGNMLLYFALVRPGKGNIINMWVKVKVTSNSFELSQSMHLLSAKYLYILIVEQQIAISVKC